MKYLKEPGQSTALLNQPTQPIYRSLLVALPLHMHRPAHLHLISSLPGLSLQARRRYGMVPVQTLSSVAQQRRELGALHTQDCAAVLANMFSPTTSYFCFLKEGTSYALCSCKGGRAHLSELGAWRGLVGWVGTWDRRHKRSFPMPCCSPPAPQDAPYTLILRVAALQGVRGSTAVLFTQLLPGQDCCLQ